MLASLSLRLIRDSANDEMWAVNDKHLRGQKSVISRQSSVVSREGGIGHFWQVAVIFEVVGLFDELAAVHPEG